MENTDYPALERRMGREALAERMIKQAGKTAKLLHQGEGVFRIERYIPLDTLVGMFLRLSGLGALGRRGFLDVRAVEVEWRFPRLPRPFDGFRLLQLSDLHLDIDPSLADVVRDLVLRTPHDAAVVTGDFRNETDGDYLPAMQATARVVEVLAPWRRGILGNHDFIEMVPSLEALGLPMLLNEAVALGRDEARIWVAGIDDPHFYKTGDLDRVRAAVPDGEFCILLSHSPETYAEAAVRKFDLQLSGHTHGGQLCLPGGRHLVIPCRVPRKFVAGRWDHEGLAGYTSPGTGSCGVAARLNCPPEITVHILRTAEDA